MNIERIELTNYGSWADLDLPISPGVSLISGQNGTGKSTILSAVEFGLFGATSDAGRLIRRGTDEAIVRVYLDDGLVVTRRARRSGQLTKITLRLHRFVDEEDHDELSAATTGETQVILDGLLGVSRETLRASAFSMQGDGAAFCEARPADRKKILTDTMPSMALWPLLHEQAKAELADARSVAATARADLERLDGVADRQAEAVARLTLAMAAVEDAEEAERLADENATRLAAEAEDAREARRQHAAAVEAAERARADHARATAERAAADEALARAKSAAANAPSVGDARASVEMAAIGVRTGETLFNAATTERSRWIEQTDTARRELADLQGERESGDCARCGQPLHADITERLVEATRAYRELGAREEPVPDGTLLHAARRTLQAAQTRLAEAETIELLAGTIDAFEERARAAMDREGETAAQVRASDAAVDEAINNYCADPDIEQRHTKAIQTLSDARGAKIEAAAHLARAEAAAQAAEKDAAEEQAARERLATAEHEAAIAGILAAGFGPTGVPAMIVDSVLGDLADEANRVLAELGSPIRCELRSQRVTKDGRLVDALEIIAHVDAMEAPYETLSGGERTRLALALRAALTRLLASKRGARVRILVVDEPAGLDSAGCEQLAAVLQEFVTAGVFETVILVTHQTELADQIGRTIRIEKSASGESRLVENRGPTTPGEIEPERAGDSAGARETLRAASPGTGPNLREVIDA